jgi:hypothetical protein
MDCFTIISVYAQHGDSRDATLLDCDALARGTVEPFVAVDG